MPGFDLIDVLEALGRRAERGGWRCVVEECIGIEDINSAELGAKFNGAAQIPGDALKKLARQTRQLIDGTFRAFDSGAVQPWAVVEASDRTCWEVRTDDEAALQSLRARFGDLEELREEAV